MGNARLRVARSELAEGHERQHQAVLGPHRRGRRCIIGREEPARCASHPATTANRSVTAAFQPKPSAPVPPSAGRRARGRRRTPVPGRPSTYRTAPPRSRPPRSSRSATSRGAVPPPPTAPRPPRTRPVGPRPPGRSRRAADRARGRRRVSHEATQDRFSGQRDPPALGAFGEPELVVEIEEVLLDRRLGDHEFGCDLADGRRHGDGAIRCKRPAQRREDVAFSACQLRHRGRGGCAAFHWRRSSSAEPYLMAR